jgi:hypothetical protein
MICGRPRRELFLAACRPYSAIGFTQVSEWLSQYVSSAGCGQRAYPPIWRQSNPADELSSPVQNGVIGAATTRTQ